MLPCMRRCCHLLLLLLPGSLLLGARACPEPTNATEAYDSPPYTSIATQLPSATQHLCDGTGVLYGGRMVQLFTPHEVPWRYTSVCFILVAPRGNNGTVVRGSVEMFDAVVQDNSLRPGALVASHAFRPLVFDASPRWATVDLGPAGLVARSRGVFIGVNWWSCGTVGVVVSVDLSVGRLVLDGSMPDGWILCHGSPDTLGIIRALALRADGVPHSRSSVPPLWTCSPAAYNDSVCSCNCGAWDPACARDPRSPDCGRESICDSSGRCTAPSWDTKACDLKSYWAYDGCQCECGGDPDPDCFDPFAPVSVCGNQANLSIPFCSWSDGAQSQCSETWTCGKERYGDGHRCDCECGVMDPDCLSPYNETSCADDWQCVNGKCAVVQYHDGVACDCNCGDYDPDCDSHLTLGYHSHNPPNGHCYPRCGDGEVVEGEECDSGAFCEANCTCQAGHSPYRFREKFCTGCGNGHIDDSEQCDSGDGCSECSCVSGFHPTSPLSPHCAREGVGAEAKRKVAIAGGVGGGSGLLLLVAVVCALFYARKVKNGPRPLNMPMEISGNATFVPSEDDFPPTSFGSPMPELFIDTGVGSPELLPPSGIVQQPSPDCPADCSPGQVVMVDSQGQPYTVRVEQAEMAENMQQDPSAVAAHQRGPSGLSLCAGGQGGGVELMANVNSNSVVPLAPIDSEDAATATRTADVDVLSMRSGGTDAGEPCPRTATSEVYDMPEYTTIDVQMTSTTQHLCDGSGLWYAGKWVQLFTPRTVPWMYTSVCFGVSSSGSGGNASATATVRGSLEVYDVAADAYSQLLPGTLLASYSFRPLTFAGSTWLQLDFGSYGIVAWSRGVFIGVNWWSCDHVGMLVSTNTSAGRLVYEGTSGWQQCYGSPGSRSATRALALRTDGAPYPRSSIPPLWTCTEAEYNDSACSCNCGAWDPACARDPRSLDCGSGSICDNSGRCTVTGWNTSACDLRRYWAYDGCQCECGGDPDPDCFDPFASVSVCGAQRNLSIPFCSWSYGAEAVCAETWTCGKERYHDGYRCDCECGVMDPDCLLDYNQTSCAGNWRCISGKCAVPEMWMCSESMYNDGTSCDCMCGAYDPDCDMHVPVYNCVRSQELCGYNGQCIPPGCGNKHVETWGTPPEECDGGAHCEAESCRCDSGYHSRNPPTIDCYPKCGDGVVVEGEECDGGAFCSNCTCQRGHEPYNDRHAYCKGCGNNHIDENEQCDSGDGCFNCTCVSGYHSTSPASTSCIRSGDTNSKKKVAIAGGVGGGCGFILLIAVVCALLYARKVKYGPRPINMPLEMSGNTTFVASDGCLDIPVASISSPMHGYLSSPPLGDPSALAATVLPLSGGGSGGSGGHVMMMDSQGQAFAVSMTNSQIAELAVQIAEDPALQLDQQNVDQQPGIAVLDGVDGANGMNSIVPLAPIDSEDVTMSVNTDAVARPMQ
eukprot:m51a1_g7720 putative protein kinase domain containing protein (1438) ;mRNA; r:137464-143831